MSLYLNADCMNPETGLPSYPDKYFDLAIVDPPYGIGIVAPGKRTTGIRSGQKVFTKYKGSNWDSMPPTKEYFEELFRVSKNQIIWGANYFVNHLPPSKCWIAWDKRQPEETSFAMIELAYGSFDRTALMFSCSKADMSNTVSNNERIAKGNAKIHPTQKPIVLYRWLLKHFAKPGMRLLDTHVGSASSLIAFEEMGFEYVGYELDADYYRESSERLAKHRAQGSLFSGREIFEASAQKTLFEE